MPDERVGPPTGVGATGFDARGLCRHLLLAALHGADPGPPTARAVAEIVPGSARAARIIAIGKAAPAMARAALTALGERGIPVRGGVVVSHQEVPQFPRPLEGVAGDHPLPARRSLHAADRVSAQAALAAPDEIALVLLSGGASSLVAAPVPGVEAGDLARLTSFLLGSGLDISGMNTVRRAVLRWGAGRLAGALAGAAHVHCLVVSDVPGDDPATVGSGPCASDPEVATRALAVVRRAGLEATLPRSLVRAIEEQAERARIMGDGPAAGAVTTRLILSNRDALDAAATAARALGVAVDQDPAPLIGEASAVGASLARAALDAVASGRELPRVILRGGETTVTLGADAGIGGRCQELALAAARVLHAAPSGARVALLAVGTDGRDGPTDAAGAFVDGGTWARIAAADRDPAADLARHDAWHALDAAGALVRTGPTGTNVMDLVIVVAS